MHILLVNCNQCETVTSFLWCFNDDVIMSAEMCKKCSESFRFIIPKQKTENIITNQDFLPHINGIYYNAFCCKKDGKFHYYQLTKGEISFPILFLTTTIGQFGRNEECLVKISDVEKFVNKSKQFEKNKICILA